METTWILINLIWYDCDGPPLTEWYFYKWILSTPHPCDMANVALTIARLFVILIRAPLPFPWKQELNFDFDI